MENIKKMLLRNVISVNKELRIIAVFGVICLQKNKHNPREQLEGIIRTHDKQMAKHEGWLKEPKRKVLHWDSLKSEYQENLLHHWQKDVDRHKA